MNKHIVINAASMDVVDGLTDKQCGMMLRLIKSSITKKHSNYFEKVIDLNKVAKMALVQRIGNGDDKSSVDKTGFITPPEVSQEYAIKFIDHFAINKRKISKDRYNTNMIAASKIHHSGIGITADESIRLTIKFGWFRINDKWIKIRLDRDSISNIQQ